MSDHDSQASGSQAGDHASVVLPEIWKILLADRLSSHASNVDGDENEDEPEEQEEREKRESKEVKPSTGPPTVVFRSLVKHLRENPDDVRLLCPLDGRSVMLWMVEHFGLASEDTSQQRRLLEFVRRRGRDVFPFPDSKEVEALDKYAEHVAALQRPRNDDEEEQEEEEEEAQGGGGDDDDEAFDEEGGGEVRRPKHKPDIFERIAKEIEADPYRIRSICNLGIFVGERDEDGRRHGWGQTLYKNGELYFGEFQDGFRKRGVHYYVDKSAYVGEFDSEGYRSGRGTFFYADGSIYQGEFSSGRRNGKGKYSYINGDQYDGSWRDDCKHGAGEMYIASSGDKLNGTWIRNSFVSGTWTTSSGSVYTGVFSNGRPFLNGIFGLPSGLFEIGYFDGNGIWRKDCTVSHVAEYDTLVQKSQNWTRCLERSLCGIGPHMPTSSYQGWKNHDSLPNPWNPNRIFFSSEELPVSEQDCGQSSGFLLDCLNLFNWILEASNVEQPVSTAIVACSAENVPHSSFNVCVIPDLHGVGDVPVCVDLEGVDHADTIRSSEYATRGRCTLTDDLLSREDIAQTMRRSRIILFDGSSLLAQPDLGKTVYSRISNTHKFAVKLPIVSEVEASESLALVLNRANVVFSTESSLHSFASCFGWKSNNINILMNRVHETFSQHPTVVVYDTLGCLRVKGPDVDEDEKSEVICIEHPSRVGAQSSTSEPPTERSSVRCGLRSLTAVAAGYLSQLAWPFSSASLHQCIRGAVSMLNLIGYDGALEPIDRVREAFPIHSFGFFTESEQYYVDEML